MLQNFLILSKAGLSSLEWSLKDIWFLEVFNLSEYKLKHSASILEARVKSIAVY